MVPLSVSFAGETYRDGELSQAAFFERMRAIAPALPTTSQPAPGAFADVYERLLRTAEQVISIHISNRLSGTIESARQAAEAFEGRVHVFDSLNLSWGTGLQVVEAVRAADAGLAVTEALARLERARDRARIVIGLDSLENLARGGRIGRVSALLGAMLNLKVTFRVGTDGAFEPVGRDRGEKAALAHTLDWVADQIGSRAAHFAVGSADSLARAEMLAKEIRERFNVVDLVMYEAGPVICTHTGRGWGVAALPAD